MTSNVSNFKRVNKIKIQFSKMKIIKMTTFKAFCPEKRHQHIAILFIKKNADQLKNIDIINTFINLKYFDYF